MTDAAYMREWRSRNRDHARAYNRNWMRAYRQRLWEEAGGGSKPPLTVAATLRTERQLFLLERAVEKLPRLLTEEQRERGLTLLGELEARLRELR